MDQTQKETLYALAERIYNLDLKVQRALGSALGRVYSDDKKRSIAYIMKMMVGQEQEHALRRDIALIGNMARTIKDDDVHKEIMTEYNAVIQALIQLPDSIGSTDVLNQEAASLNLLKRFSGKDHMVICISRTYGCGGSEIGFLLADTLKINYYDTEIFDRVLNRLEAEQDFVLDRGGYQYEENEDSEGGTEEPRFKYSEPVDPSDAPKRKITFKQRLRQFSRYHGLSKRDAVFFNQSNLICEMAKTEDFVVMGRCAEVILTNNHIPHISIFITAPFEERVRHVHAMMKEMSDKNIRKMLRKLDHQHISYYKFYTGRRWGAAENYDLSINSSCYGIQGTVDLIEYLLKDMGNESPTVKEKSKQRMQ